MSFSSINTPVSGSRNPVMYINGLTADWLSNTTLTLNVGACSDSNNIIDMVVSSALTINAAATGVLGLDTGSLAASTFYYVFVIGDSSGFNQPSAMISKSATAPLMPYGYDSFRMVDVKVTDGSSHFLLSYTNGYYGDREFVYDAPLSVGALTTAATYAAIALTACVAPIGTPKVTFIASFTPNAAEDVLYLRPTGGTGDEAKLSGVVAAKDQIAELTCLAFVPTTAASIDFKTTSSSDAAALLVKSFTFNV